MKGPIQVLAGPGYSIIFFKKVEDEAERQEVSSIEEKQLAGIYALKRSV
jgi:hypothetical protein